MVIGRCLLARGGFKYTYTYIIYLYSDWNDANIWLIGRKYLSAFTLNLNQRPRSDDSSKKRFSDNLIISIYLLLLVIHINWWYIRPIKCLIYDVQSAHPYVTWPFDTWVGLYERVHQTLHLESSLSNIKSNDVIPRQVFLKAKLSIEDMSKRNQTRERIEALRLLFEG